MDESKIQPDNHSSDCECVYCDKDAQNVFEKLLRNPESPIGQDLSDKPNNIGGGELGKVKPQIMKGSGQSINEVKELIRLAEEQECKFKNIESVDREPILTFKDEMKDDCQTDIRETKELYEMCPNSNTNALWRKLSGVKDKEPLAKPENHNLTDELIDCINSNIIFKFPKLKVTWENNHGNQILTVNGANTKISIYALAEAYDALNKLVEGKEEIKDILTNIIIGKLAKLFI